MEAQMLIVFDQKILAKVLLAIIFLAGVLWIYCRTLKMLN